IVTIASAASKLAPPGESTYAATKHAVLGYLTGVREELRGSGVHVSVIMPGVVDTELAVGTDSGATARLQPSDVAAAVVKVLRRPRFEVTLPASIDLLVRITGLLPQSLRDQVLRRTVPNQVEAMQDSNTREGYEHRALTDTTDPRKS
ncbi:SDR family NAD(P)-dependent oxidoreductase, partial [Nocardia sp. NPDC058497]|uniref:SDR family NAD(P)-dependent oxidoreductase n=1 Tax=Nocardia sp. NPDC058497 TaxID=3346529 RepID=UPI0036668CE2